MAFVNGFSKDNSQALNGREPARLYVERLRHPKPRVREEAAREIAGVNWNGAQPPLDELIRLLKDPVAQVRACAADALGAIGRLDAAPHLLNTVDDESRVARFRAAFALENLNPPIEIDERVDAWRRVVQRDPQNVYALCNLSMAFRDQGERAAAIEAAYRAIELHPDHFYPYLLTGRLCAEANDRDAAIRYYECAVYCDPERPMPHYELGETRRLGGDYEQAVQCYERANELTGGRAECYFGLGFCFNRLGDYGGAIDAYQRCLEMHPDHYIALNNLGPRLPQRRRAGAGGAPFQKSAGAEPRLRRCATEPRRHLRTVRVEPRRAVQLTSGNKVVLWGALSACQLKRALFRKACGYLDAPLSSFG